MIALKSVKPSIAKVTTVTATKAKECFEIEVSDLKPGKETSIIELTFAIGIVKVSSEHH